MVGISPRDRGNIGDTANILPDSTAKGPRPGQKIPKAMDKEGTVGKQFTEHGALGGAAQRLGGPFDKEGMIGKQFTEQGGIGGKAQEKLGGTKEKNM